MARKYTTVSLDGVSYIPADDRPLDKEARALLASLWNSIKAEVHYDPDCEATRKFAAYLEPKITRLNELLGFKA